MIHRRIADLVMAAIQTAQQRGMLPTVAELDLGIGHPAQADHGDYASTVALRLARAARMQPRQIAEMIRDLIPSVPEVAKKDVAGAGFINFTLSDSWLAQQVEAILAAGDKFGSILAEQRMRVQVEYVSANPTGPLHAGNGRGAILGDTIANVLAFAGHDVQREYYVNDAGAQVRLFGQTLLARYRQAFAQDAALPEGGYAGHYMIRLAEEIMATNGDSFLSLEESQAVAELGEVGMRTVLGWIERDLVSLGIHFDRWFSERSLFEEGLVQAAIDRLRAASMVDEREGAIWFASTQLGEDKDNVIVRSNGAPTYFATDIAYHYNKFASRRFDQVIDVWGADHQGHVSRMKAVVGALGSSPDALTIVLFQLVTLKRGGEVVRLSKRTGDIVTLEEVVEEVGADACRFFFLARSADSQMDFDLDLAKEQSDKNPVYYVQYAHARIASILRLAEERGIDWSDGDVSVLVLEPEMTLVRKMLLFPETVELAAQNLEPHHLTYYAQSLATAFHSFYRQCRVVSDDVALTSARLKLVAAAKVTLANALRLMGMSAPERMDRIEN